MNDNIIYDDIDEEEKKDCKRSFGFCKLPTIAELMMQQIY